jgi:hypothetical protein
VDVAAWLRDLGLEPYERAFRDNRIDAEVLPKLTVEDLKEIGVAAVGDRRKMAGLKTVPCWVRPLDDEAAYMLLATSNAQGELTASRAACTRSALPNQGAIPTVSLLT